MNPSAADDLSRPLAIPFLITHWLSDYGSKIRTGNNTAEAHAIARIQSSTIELAQAFADLGAYGTTILGKSRLIPDEGDNDVQPKTILLSNASYRDILNRFSHQLNGSKHPLESIVASSDSIFHLRENDSQGYRHLWRPLFQAPILLTSTISSQNSSPNPSTCLPTTIRENSQEFFIAAAQASRRYLDIQFKIQQELNPQESMILRSKKFHQRSLQQQLDPSQVYINKDVSQRVLLQLEKAFGDIEIQRRQLDRDFQMALSILLTFWKQAIFNSTHFAYSYNLNFNMHGTPAIISNGDTMSTSNIVISNEASHLSDQNTSTIQSMPNGILRTLVARQYAVGRSNTIMSKKMNRVYHPTEKFQSLPLSVSSTWSNVIGFTLPYCRIPNMLSSQRSSAKSLIKTILSTRMSHCTTINAHLTFPVYCFCFDKTGNYFFTGADDNLVKAFRLIPSSDFDLEDVPNASIYSSIDGEYMSFNTNLNNPTLLHDRNKYWSGEDNAILSPSPTKVLFSKASHPSPYDQSYYKKAYPSIRGGAILVATFRGHAGVISDMDVAVDNSMLASASVDGDVRVWTLHGSKRTPMGIPVAILRGHTGGANMVAWSHRVPYQLVTTAQDGWARVWDVRMAAMKRSVNILGSRLDYSWVSFDHESSSMPRLRKREGRRMNSTGFFHGKKDNEHKTGKTNGLTDVVYSDKTNPPTMASTDVDHLEPLQNSTRLDESSLPIEDFKIMSENNSSRDDQNDATRGQLSLGAFITSSSIDSGVVLIGELFHGNSTAPTESTQSVNTRSRIKSVSVICVSRCPLGGHFATGSDDGVGRIWSEDEETRIEDLDFQLLAHQRSSQRVPSRISSNAKSGVLIATLTGHLNAITDIQYSYAGDRLLTASQKDGVVRVWSWGSESFLVGDSLIGLTGPKKIDNFRQVIIRLPKNASMNANASLPLSTLGHGRRRGGIGPNTAGVDVYCDVAIWSSDDSKIITSQYSPLRSTATEPLPGSHAIYIWDSNLGQCLMGINAAHSAGCPVIISHPLDPSILVSAGTDGYVKLWDLDDGRQLFSHFNTLEHGPIEPPLTKGQCCGFLDGDFSDDGLTLILTDDLGRVCIINALHDAESIKEMKLNGVQNSTTLMVEGNHNGFPNTSKFMKEPTWMKEQYFANDYYELVYDNNGYGVEQGSGQLSHLAPRAARCNHNGVPYSERIQDSFRCIAGPMPIKEQDVRIAREILRHQAFLVRNPGGMLEQNINGKRPMVLSHCMESTLYVGPKISPKPGARIHSTSDALTNAYSNRRTNTQTGRTLSTNYRWRDYDDIQDDVDVDDMDEDDEDYLENAPNPANDSADDDDDDDDKRSFEEESDESVRISTRNSRRHGQSRTSTQRGPSNSRRILDIDEEDSENQEQEDDNHPAPKVKRNLRANVNQKFKYNDPDSSDEEIEELLSRTKIPSGEFAEDYNTLGHYFKMPSKCKIHRNWVTRSESSTGFTGQKPYCPQVGDSVVYIPRAHYDTLRTFPNASNMSAPWKLFPTNSSWPVVRCSVRDLRYRFPYEMYYRSNGSTKVVSVVIILTLEVTGIPETSLNRKYPWPKPKFIASPSRLGPLLFNVSLFLNGEVDFLVPEALFIWRIASLEKMIRQERRIDGLSIYTQYNESDGKDDEDNSLVPYPGEILYATSSCDDEIHFQNSGYNVINVRFPHNDLIESMCVWEISPASGRYNGPRPRTLDRDQKTAVRKIIDELEEDTDIQTYFSLPVDSSRYVDYLSIVEVPMDFSLIRQRLKNDFYSTLLGVSSDIRLIRDNCFKYNESDAVISIAARDMFDRFMERFEGVLNSHVGQKQPIIDRHLALVPDEDEEIDILNPGIQRAERLSRETIADPISPPRQSARLGRNHNRSSNFRETTESLPEFNVSARRSNRSALDSRLSEQPSIVEGQAMNLRTRSRFNASLQNHQNELALHAPLNSRSRQSHLQSRHDLRSARLTRSSHSESVRESRSNGAFQQNHLNEDRSSQVNLSPSSGLAQSQPSGPTHSPNSDNMRATRSNRALIQRNLPNDSLSSEINQHPHVYNGSASRRLRSLNSGSTDHLRSSVWDNGPPNSSTTIRIRMTTNSDRLRRNPNRKSFESSDMRDLSSTLNTSISNRGTNRSALHHSSSSLTDHLSRGNTFLSNTRTTRRQTRNGASSLLHDQCPSVLEDHALRHNITTEDERTTRRLTRRSALNLLSPSSPDDLNSNKRKSRHPSVENEKSKTNGQNKTEPTSISIKNELKKNVTAPKTKSRRRSEAESYDYLVCEDPSFDDKSSKKGDRKKYKKDSDESDVSFEEDSQALRRITRGSRKNLTYKEESDYNDDSENTNSDDESNRKSSNRNRAKKRSRLH